MSNYLSKIKYFGLEEQHLVDENFSAVIEYSNIKLGMGNTIGNSLRRVLLSSVPGYAIKNVTIAGIQHEFTAIPGVKEDAQRLIMNLKKVIFKGDISKSKATILFSGPGEVRASDISCSNISVVNPDLYICSIDKGFNLKAELFVEKGCGVKLTSTSKDYEIEIGSILCDAFFSPIVSVNFEVIENESSNSESLHIHIVTNGSIAPKDAFKYALELFMDQLSKNAYAEKEKDEISLEEKKEASVQTLSPNLFLRIDDLPDLPTRTLRCLKMLGVVYVGDVVKLTRERLMNEPNFGENSLNKLIEKLEAMELSLGMNIVGWPPENLEEKAEAIRNKSVL